MKSNRTTKVAACSVLSIHATFTSSLSSEIHRFSLVIHTVDKESRYSKHIWYGMILVGSPGA